MLSLEAVLRLTDNIPDENRLDIDISEDGLSFRAVEVRPNLSTVRERSGEVSSVFGGYAIMANEEPDLSLAQLRVFEPLRIDWEEKIRQAQGSPNFFLMREGEHPEIVDSFRQYPSINGNIKPEMLSVWHALNNILDANGYNLALRQYHNKPWEIWVTPARRP